MTLHTRFCDIAGIRYPIIQAPMAWIAGARLAAAVSNAGALGVIAQGTGDLSFNNRRYEIEGMRSEIQLFRKLSNKPFAAGLAEDPEKYMDMLVEEKVPIVITAMGDPSKFTPFFKKYGVKVFHMGSTVKHAKKCEALGVDAFILAGFESGGHDPGGRDYLTTFAGIPQLADAVTIPVLAAGGIADGRGLAAALILGAEGVRMGTRFVATQESLAHEAHKQLIVSAIDTSTVWRGRLWGDYLRSFKTPYVNKIYELELKGSPLSEILSCMGGEGDVLERTSLRRLKGQTDGNLQEGEFHGGQIAGLIKEILPAGEVVQRIVKEAEAILAHARERYGIS